MEIRDSSLEGLKIIELAVHRDQRGSFRELFCDSRYPQPLAGPYLQENCSISQRGVLRGLHFQRTPGQAKLVTVVQGEVFDVAVDIRPDSPTFGKWEAVTLSESNGRQFFIPVGFAHGFCVLSETACVVYKMSSLYDPREEKGFRWDDPTVAIAWPIHNPILSERDQQAPLFSEAFA